ncbi:hypothetical protein ACVWXQ_001498 [Bradyrhizobium sp. S3.14.4]
MLEAMSVSGRHALAAGDAEPFQEALGNRIGFLAGEPPRLCDAIQALDGDDIGNAEAGEGVVHIAFPDEPAQVRIGCRKRLDLLALAAGGIGDVVNECRARDLHLDRPCVDAARHAVAGTGFEREAGTVT